MLIKVGGALIIVLASVFASADLVACEKRRIECIEGFLLMVSYIKNSIECYSIPIKRIISECDPAILKKLGADGKQADFDQLILGCEDFLREDTLKTLREFSSALGKSYRDIQIRICNKTIGELEGQKKDLKDAYPSKRRTLIALCIAIGGMAVIALI